MTTILEKWQNLSPRTRDILLALLAALLAFLPRIFGLAVFLTADEPKSWFGRSIQFLEALATGNFANTFDSPAPGVTTMWAGTIGLLLDYARQGFPGSLTEYLAAVPFDPLDPAILPLIRLGGVLVVVLTAALTYWWGKDVFGRTAAFLAAAFIAFDPFILALSRILGHDALVSLFMWLSLLAFLRAFTTPTQKNNSPFTIHHSPFIIISGTFGGLAFLTKYPSLSLGAFIAVTMLILYLRSGRSFSAVLKDWFVDMLLWSLAAGAVFVIFFPAMWVAPIQTVQAILADAFRASGSPHQKGSFFLGRPVADPGAAFYILVTLFKTTPVLWFGWMMLAIGPIFQFKDEGGRRKDEKETKNSSFIPHPSSLNYWQLIIIFAAFALFYGILVSVGGKKQDRYILPAFPALIAIASLGYLQLVNFVVRNFQPSSHRKKGGSVDPNLRSQHPQMRLRSASDAKRASPLENCIYWDRGVVTAGVLAVVIAMQVFFTLPHHPYYFTYYNSLMGGGKMASKLMIVGWGEGMDAAARWLNAQPNAKDLNAVAWYSTTFEPFFEGNAIYKIGEEKISRTAKPGLAADYVVFYINQVQRQLPSEGALQHFQAISPAYTVTLRGTDYAWIYPSIGLQRIIQNEARLVGQAELLGYNITKDEGGRMKDEGEKASSFILPPSSFVRLYWEWQGKSPDETIGLSLVDETGEVWGEGEALGTEARLPFEEWQEGMVARDDFSLSVFPGAPPGEYILKAWIDRPTTGEVVGVFPLNDEDVRVRVSRPAEAPAISDLALTQMLDAPVGDEMLMLGIITEGEWTESWQAEQFRRIILYWQLNSDFSGVDAPQEVTLTLVDDDGKNRAQWREAIANGRFPSGDDQPGDIIRDPRTLTLPPHVPPGEYDLTAALAGGEAISLAKVTVAGRPRSFELPPLDLPLEAQFGDGIRLLGLQGDLNVEPDKPLEIALIWQAANLVDGDYIVTVQLLDGENQVRAQRDSAPLGGAALTTSWTPGEVLADKLSPDLPSDLGPAPHRLLIAFYHPETGERLLLADGSDHLEVPTEVK